MQSAVDELPKGSISRISPQRVKELEKNERCDLNAEVDVRQGEEQKRPRMPPPMVLIKQRRDANFARNE